MPSQFLRFRLSDYDPFGSTMLGRTFSNENYRFGFNGKELDNETFTDAYDFGARILDTRIGRWLSVDPLWIKFEYSSSFVFSNNSPIVFNDLDGKQGELTGSGTQDDPYVIKATYAYVENSLSTVQLDALNAAAALYNQGSGKDANHPKPFKCKQSDGSYMYYKYEISVVSVTEAEVATPEAKSKLLDNETYGFTDENGNKRSSLNFVEIDKTGLNNGTEHQESLGVTKGNTITLNEKKCSEVEKDINNHLKQNQSISCNNTDELMETIMVGTFVHEIYHSLGGDHEDLCGEETILEMSNALQVLTTSQTGECYYQVLVKDIVPTKQGAENLISECEENNSLITSSDEATKISPYNENCEQNIYKKQTTNEN